MSGRKDGMSRQLSKLRSLVSEIEEIQRIGRGKAPESVREFTPVESAGEKTEKIIQQMIEPKESVRPVSPVSEGMVSLELGGNVSVKLKLEESNEIIEVRRIGDHLAISFADGKSVHLPLKSVA